MTFSQDVAAGAPLIGTFIKTPHHMIIEALGGTGLDYVILDAEHSTFGIAEIDRCLLAARASGLPALVRLTEGRPADILRVLDMGATGFLVPHVVTADQARAIVAASQYGAGGRGFAGTTRAGNYGRVPVTQHLEASKDVVVVLQIEDPEGVEDIEEIAAVPGIGACFIGRADLAVAYGTNDLDAPAVEEAVEKVVAACKANGIPLSTFAPKMEDARAWFDRGVSMIAVASEHKPMQDFFSKAAAAAAKGQDPA